MAIVTRLFIGCNDRDTKKQEKSCAEIKELIHDILALHNFNAYTLQSASGVFTHEDGAVVNENTYIITLVNAPANLGYVIDNFKIALNQESIMVEQHQSRIEFI